MIDDRQILYPVIKDGKYGFINTRGQVTIDFEFDSASTFTEGLARIFVKDKVGYIDLNGNIVIQPIFDSGLGFSDGLAVITIKDKQGYINKTGDIIIKPTFYRADDFENEIAFVMERVDSKGSYINKQGKTILSGRNYLVSKFSEGLINCGDNGNWGHIDLNNQFIIPPIYNYTRKFAEGKAAVSPKKDINGKSNKKELCGFINKQNEMVIPPIYQGADIHFSEGLCAVWDKSCGYINETGQLVIPYSLDLGQHFSDGLAVFKPVGKNKNYGYIDKNGSIAIEPKFTNADSFENGIASVITGKEYSQFKYGYIDKNGDYLWEPSR